MKSKNQYTIFVAYVTISIILMSSVLTIGTVQARTEEILDSGNNNLKISMQAPDDWNSGIVSQTVAKLNWRLNGLTATNDDLSAFFAVVNLPSLANLALPLSQKSGILSLILAQYVTINKESDVILSDGSPGHLYSISVSTEQLHHLNAPIDKGFDGILITTKQGQSTYVVLYATQQGRMGDFQDVLQNMFNSIRFGSVGFSGQTSPASGGKSLKVALLTDALFNDSGLAFI